MVDEFEKSAVSFAGDLPLRIKNNIRSQLHSVQGSKENLKGYDRAQYLLGAQKLTGLELKRLQNEIDSLPRDQQGKITDPSYNLIGGDALHTFIKQETARLRHVINKTEENQEELGKTEKQDVNAPKPPDLEGVTGLPRLGLELNEEIKKINRLIQY